MSVRANIKIKDNHSELMFYRHSGGHPGETLTSLKKFMKWVEDNKIRRNVSQAAGWLIIIGAEEYNTRIITKDGIFHSEDLPAEIALTPEKGARSNWKVGAYEPTPEKHKDIDYFYELNLNELVIKVCDGDGKLIKSVNNFDEGV